MTVRRKDKKRPERLSVEETKGNHQARFSAIANTNTNWPSEQPGSPLGSVLLLTVSP